MKITVDTNILIRAVVRDDKKQAQVAATLLRDAEIIAVSPGLLVRIRLGAARLYKFEQQDISAALEALLNAASVAVNRPAVDAGLAVFKAGGDFCRWIDRLRGQLAWRRHFCLFRQKGRLTDRQAGTVGQVAHLINQAMSKTSIKHDVDRTQVQEITWSF